MDISLKIKKVNSEIALYHKELIKILDNVNLETLPVINIQSSSKVVIDISSFEEITNLTYKLYEKDRALQRIYREKRQSRSKNKITTELRNDLSKIKKEILDNKQFVTREIKKVSLIVKEYRERCNLEFINFLKTLDQDLRKTLKPLVPSDVLDEQIKYRPINEEIYDLGSLNSTKQDEENPPGDGTIDKLNSHIQLLVNTLEGVAKNLIEVTTGVYKKYYEIVDPSQLDSDPPSPLAAPLPEYFSFDLGRLSDENRRPINFLNEHTKKKIIKRINQMENSREGCLSPRIARRIKRRLEILIHKKVSQLDLLDIFKEEGVPVSRREQLVFDIINSARNGSKHVTLSDLIDASDEIIKKPAKKIGHFETTNAEFQQSSLKNEDKLMTEKAEVSQANIEAIQNSVDENAIKTPSPSPPRLRERAIKRLPASDKHLRYLPESVSVSQDHGNILTESRKQQRDVRIRSYTPNKPKNEERKSPQKRSKTPGLRKKKHLI